MYEFLCLLGGTIKKKDVWYLDSWQKFNLPFGGLKSIMEGASLALTGCHKHPLQTVLFLKVATDYLKSAFLLNIEINNGGSHEYQRFS